MFTTALKKKLNFAHSLLAENPDHIFLVRGIDTTGDNAWYYVMIDRGKRDAFRNQNGVDLLNITDYGTILHSGFGDHPPEAIRMRMEEEYGFITGN